MLKRMSEKDFPDITVFYRTLAYMWLRYEQGCYVVTFERHPYDEVTSEKPDVLGLTKRRRLIEVELKVSSADLKKDLQKRHRANIQNNIMRHRAIAPSRLYYMVPAHLVGEALAILPPHTGVISPHRALRDSHSGFPAVALHRRATALHDEPVSVQTAVRMVRDLSGTMTSLLTELVYLLRAHPDLIHGGRLNFDAKRVHENERLPQPFKVTPPQAILDHGDRTGHQVQKADVDRQWRERQRELRTPTTSVRRAT